ncbi:MAG: IS630 family transposase [Actinobacteria bacterium]|nr:IS630 family transposase [Actinomycetota bacterium]
MARGRPKAVLELTEEETTTLARWARRPSSPQSLALRSRIVLACADGKTNNVVAAEVGVNPATVSKWRRRFVELRLDGLCDEPRPGAPRKIGDDQVEAVIVKTLNEQPKGATHWSSRALAAETGMTQATVSRIWRAFGLKPWLTDGFKLSNDPLFIDKVRDVVAMYLNPPEAAVVFCVDEKTQVQALNRTQPVLPMRPAQPERQTHDYERHGTTSLFAALNLATGMVIHSMSSQHRTVEFVKFLRTIDRNVPDGLDVHVILDNVSTHKAPAVHTFLLRHPRFHLHFTPTYSSWLNLVERWFAEITTKMLQRSTHLSVRQLQAGITAWIETWNDDPRPYVWVKTADEILDKLARYCQTITTPDNHATNKVAN